jgi:hypothetical protein
MERTSTLLPSPQHKILTRLQRKYNCSEYEVVAIASLIARSKQDANFWCLPLNWLMQEFVSFANLLPKGHEHWYSPTLFWQVADSGHGLGLCSHSLTSAVKTEKKCLIANESFKGNIINRD